MCCKDKNAGVNAVEVTVSHTSVHCVTADLLKMLTAEVNSVRGLVWMITEKKTRYFRYVFGIKELVHDLNTVVISYSYNIFFK